MRSLISLAMISALVVACSSGKPFENDDDDTAVDSGSSSDNDASAPANNDASTPTPMMDASAQPEAAPVEAGFDASDGFDQFQHRNLDDVNMYRATLSIAPLKLDTTLSTFALAGSNELTSDHSPHAHFITASNNGTLWTSGFNTQAGENQGDPNGWTKLSTDPTTNELDQIDAIQKAMFDEGPGTGEAHGHYENMMNAKFTRLGVGLIEVSGELYLTNDFSD